MAKFRVNCWSAFQDGQYTRQWGVQQRIQEDPEFWSQSITCQYEFGVAYMIWTILSEAGSWGGDWNLLYQELSQRGCQL